MKPGEVLGDGLLGSRVCVVLNDLDVMVALPSVVLKEVEQNSGMTPKWPLGIYVLFTDDGVLLGIHGKTSDGVITDKYSFLDLEEAKVPDIGEDVWAMWKSLRDVSDEIVESNYQILLKQTLEGSN